MKAKATKSIMKKSAFMTRRKVIIYVIATILILGIVAGFADPFITDNTKYIASYNETIVMEEQTPTTGTPEDYDLISNLKYTAYKLHHASFFHGETTGKTIADLGITTYDQYIHNTRYVLGENIVFAESISTSSMKKIAEQKYADGNIIIYRPSTSIKGNSATFSNSAYSMKYEDYSIKYGSIPNQLCKYIVNENTILSVKDENEKYKNSAKASGDESSDEGMGFDFYVPDTLVRGEDGNFKFSLKLDPIQSTLYYRNEIRTLSGADQNPKFNSVSLTITIDEKWNPISVRAVESYDIAIPVIGAPTCRGDLTEVFTQIDDPNGEIPDRDFFQAYVDGVKNNPDYVPPDIPDAPLSPADYLAAAFADYLSGNKNLDLTADVTSGGISAYDVILSLNIGTMDVQAVLGDLYIKYSGDKVNIKLNEINGYLSTSQFSDLLANERLSGLLGRFEGFDIMSLFGGDILGTVFQDCEMTSEDGITRIQLPFTIDTSGLNIGLDSVYVDASIYIYDDGKVLKSITGDIELLGRTVSIVAKPLSTPPSFPSTDDAVDLSGVIDILPELLNTASQTIYGVSGTVSAMGQTFGVDAYIDRTDGIKADAVISVFGIDISVKLVNDAVYVAIGNIEARGTLEDLPELIDAVTALTDLGRYVELIKQLLPTSVNGYISMLKALEATDEYVKLEMNILTAPATLQILRKDGAIGGVKLDFDFDKFGIKLDVAADLELSSPETREIEIPSNDTFISLQELTQVLIDIAPYIDDNKNYNVVLNGSIVEGHNVYAVSGEFAIDKLISSDGFAGVSASGSLTALGQTLNVVYAEDTAYLTIGNINAKFAVADGEKFKSPILRLINLFTSLDALTDSMPEKALGAVRSIAANEDGAIVVEIAATDCALTAVIDVQAGAVTLRGTALGANIDLSLEIRLTEDIRSITPPENAQKFIDCAQLDVTLCALADIIERKSLTYDLDLTAGGINVNAVLFATFDGGIKLNIKGTTLPLDLTVIGNTLYIELGEIRIIGTLDDIDSLLAALSDVVPTEILETVEAVLGGAIDIESALRSALDAIESVELIDSRLVISINANGDIVTVAASADLSSVAIEMTVNGAAVSASLAANGATKNITAPNGEFVQASDIVDILPDIFDYIDSAAYSVGFNAAVVKDGNRYALDGNALIGVKDDIKASTTIRMFEQTLNLVYADNNVYARIAELKAKLAVADALSMKDPVMNLIGALGIDLKLDLPIDFDNVMLTASTLLGYVRNFNVSNGTITLVLNVDGNVVTLTVTPSSGKVTLAGSVASIDINIDATVAKANANVIAPTDPETYVDLAGFDVTLDALTKIVKQKSFTALAAINLGETVYRANIAVSFENGFIVSVTEPTLPLSVTIADGKAFIALGDIKLAGSLADVNAALGTFGTVIPADMMTAVDEMMTAVKERDIAYILDKVLSAVKGMSESDGTLIVDVAVLEMTARAMASLSLSNVYIALGGDTSRSISVYGVTAESVTIETPDETGYAKASEVIAVAKPIMPLALEKAFDIGVKAKLFDTDVIGNIYINIGDGSLTGVQVEIVLNVGDLPVKIIVKNQTLYMSVGTTIRVSEPLTEQSVMYIVEQLDYVIDGLKDTVTKIIDSIKSMTVVKLLGTLSLSPAQANGFIASIDLKDNGLDIAATLGATLENDELVGLDISGGLFGLALAMSFDVATTDGVLSSLECKYTEVAGIAVTFMLTPSGAEPRDVNIISDCAPISEIAEYIPAIINLIDDATGAKALTLDLAAFAVTQDNMQTDIGVTLTVSFNPIAVDAVITLFKGTDAEERVHIKYVDGIVYIQSGNIMLSFNINTDLQRLYSIVESYVEKGYLPEYIGDEIGKLLGFKEGASIFSDISLLVERFLQILDAGDDAEKIFELLFSSLNGLSGDSTIKTIAGMTRLFMRDDNITVALDMMGITLNVTPVLSGSGDSATIETLSIDTNAFGVYIKASVTGYGLLTGLQQEIAKPENSDAYVSIVEFVEIIDHAVNTLTSFDSDGNVTFELKKFDFVLNTYEIETTTDEDGNIVNVKDESGRDKPLEQNGQKVVKERVNVSNKSADVSALKGKFVKVETQGDDGQVKVSYKFNLEAHIRLDISTLTYSTPLLIDLYVINNDSYPDGMAFIDYMENNGNGERISIDYKSVMEIVAAVMDILGVDDDTMELLLGDYRVKVDKTVFTSMDIAGLDDVRDLLNNIADAFKFGQSALDDVGAAWDLVMTAGNTEGLRERLDEIKECFERGIKNIKQAIALFNGSDEQEQEQPEQPAGGTINGKLFKDIVNGVTLANDSRTIWATIDNAITTNTKGVAAIEVTHSNGTIDSITVTDLDANTTKLDKFTTVFTSGQDIGEITLPDGYNTDTKKAKYSDFANIKHLLFDVMNTANMMEFEIGGGSGDKINLNVLSILKVDIAYSIKVKLIDQGVGAEPRYKTAVDVMLDIPGYHTNAGKLTVFGLAKCTTRLFFYDNVFYMHGVESWSGSVKGIINCTYSYDVTYKDYTFTLDDLMNMAERSDGIDRIFKDFVFKLLPLRETFIVNIHDKIIDSVKNPPEASASLKTIAQIFKGYSYENGVHNMTIGLKEATLNGSLRDVEFKIIGANDNDDNIFDNYVSHAWLTTSFGSDPDSNGSIATITLDATLNNAQVKTVYYLDEMLTQKADIITEYSRAELKSKGLNKTNIDGTNYSMEDLVKDGGYLKNQSRWTQMW
ncbi:MAG: hypothetical protein J1G01_06180 [Clostridiales bacterium]|nr:hypothetical protein [Clostridiales bacterium]